MPIIVLRGGQRRSKNKIASRRSPAPQPLALLTCLGASAREIGKESRMRACPSPKTNGARSADRAPVALTQYRRERERELSRLRLEATGVPAGRRRTGMGIGKAITLVSPPASIPGPALTEPAERSVGHHGLIAGGLDEKAVIRIEVAAELRSICPRARRCARTSLLQRTGPSTAHGHDLLASRLVTMWLGQVVGDDEGAHGGCLSGCGLRGRDARLPRMRCHCGCERRGHRTDESACPVFVLTLFSGVPLSYAPLQLTRTGTAGPDGVPGVPLVGAEIDRSSRPGSAPRTAPAPWRGRREALAFPDLVEAAGITAVAADEVLAADAQPARDPDVDGIRFGEGAAGKRLGTV